MQDISGNVYNDLTVISFHHFDKKRNSYWLCQCSCGKQKIVRKSHLISGGVSSCGCKKAIKCGNASRKHGAWAKNKRLYKIWYCMVGRGTGKRRREYYFDRGITVCDEWKNVNNFFEWAIANGYQENLEIDRIDNNKGYFPENCRWATRQEQMNNTRKTHNIFICNVKFNLYKLMSEYLISKYVFKKTSIEDIPEKERFLFLLCCKWGRK